MTDVDVNGNASGTTEDSGGGVLAKLPRTRPQRASPRRVAAREAARANGRAALTEVEPRAEEASEAKRKPASGKRRKTKARSTSGAGQTETSETTRPSVGRRPAPVADSAASTRAKSAGARPRPSDAVRTKRSQATKRPAVQRHPIPAEDPAPRQGYECEGERASDPVAPPGGPELVASAAELVGELAKAGLSAGERLFKDLFSRLPGG